MFLLSYIWVHLRTTVVGSIDRSTLEENSRVGYTGFMEGELIGSWGPADSSEFRSVIQSVHPDSKRTIVSMETGLSEEPPDLPARDHPSPPPSKVDTLFWLKPSSLSAGLPHTLPKWVDSYGHLVGPFKFQQLRGSCQQHNRCWRFHRLKCGSRL